ncbi:MAG: NBR1-Ig-like domain-containing protein [Chloroflexi bacterium]|nr:NBR1-Ig-like domain-containing protein [Chloroflexota bacterium]
MYGSRGIHRGEFLSYPGWVAVDFVSDGDVARGHADTGVYASEGGTLAWICGDIPRVGNGDGTTVAFKIGTSANSNDGLIYAHLKPGSVPYQHVFAAGEKLGELVVGNFPAGRCGYQLQQYDPKFHLHFAFPWSSSFEIDGWRISPPAAPLDGDKTVWTSVHDGRICEVGFFCLTNTEGDTSVPGGPLLPDVRDASLISDSSVPPTTPSSALRKSWRVKNTGTTTWGFGVELVHRYGDAMGGPTSVGPFGTAPGEEVDISVDLIAPNQSSSGVWQLRHGSTYFGPELRVDVRVPDESVAPPQRSEFRLTCLNCPSSVTPGQTFRPRIRVDVTGDELLGSRGDMLRNVSEPYGAWPLVPVDGRIRDGQSFEFQFSANDPIRAPESPGTYVSTWRLWRNGNLVGDPIAIAFDVGGASNNPPDRPQPLSPAEWAVFNNGGGVTLVAGAPSDPDGDQVSEYYFDVFDSHDVCNSGWISSNSWTPPCLGYWAGPEHQT